MPPSQIPPSYHLSPLQFWGLLLTVSIAILVLYLPGLGAGFVLDDHGSLRPLGDWGRIDSISKVLAYLQTGFNVGPSGRLVAQSTFLLNANAWPASAAPFLFTNIIIHILTAVIIAGFLRSLLRSANIQQADTIALLAAAIWALHPFQVSTVLYAVQRMTSLAALFSIAALWCYLPLRQALQSQQLKLAALWALALGVCSLLALGSKETAILIPQAMLLVEWFLHTNSKQKSRSAPLRSWLIICGWLPCLIVWWYLISRGINPAGFERRDFDLLERLMTQIGVVGLYIQHLIFPKVITPGVFYDGYPIVREFFSSPVTIFWSIAHTGLLISAIWARRHLPLLTFCILWFYGWHILESTTVALELVFEHRNYLPGLGFSLLVAWGLARLAKENPRAHAISAMILLLLAVMLLQRVLFWGSPLERGIIWAEQLPESTRAQENAFAVLYAADFPEEGDYYLDRSLELDPYNPYLKLKKVSRDCVMTPHMTTVDWEDLYRDLKVARRDFRLYDLLSGIWNQVQLGQCQFVTQDHLKRTINAAMENTDIMRTGVAGHLAQLSGEMYLIEGSVTQAIDSFQQARRRIRDPGVAVYQARLLASHGELIQALSILDELLLNAANSSFVKQLAEDVRLQIVEEMKNG